MPKRKTPDEYNRLEKALEPAARVAATKIVQGRVQLCSGWWFLRQASTRAELVQLGIISRQGSYRLEKQTEELFGKPVDQLTEADLRRFVGQQSGADG